MEEGQTVNIESVKYQQTGFDAIAIPDEQPTISKKAVKAQLKFAKEAVKAHIAALNGNALSKAYKANCDSKKELTLAEKRQAVKANFDAISEKDIEALFVKYAKTGLKDETMKGKLNAKFKKADVNEIWHFIAENPLPKVRTPKKAKTEDNGEGQEI